MQGHALAKTCTLHAKAETAGTLIQKCTLYGGSETDCTLHAKAEVRERGSHLTLGRLNAVQVFRSGECMMHFFFKLVYRESFNNTG